MNSKRFSTSYLFFDHRANRKIAKNRFVLIVGWVLKLLIIERYPYELIMLNCFCFDGISRFTQGVPRCCVVLCWLLWAWPRLNLPAGVTGEFRIPPRSDT